MRSRSRRPAARRALRTRTVAAVSLAVLLGACSASVGLRVSVEPEDLAREVKARLEAQVGVPLDDVTCPDALEGEPGATVRCVITAGTERYGTTVTATSVEGTTVSFSIVVDEQPLGDEDA